MRRRSSVEEVDTQIRRDKKQCRRRHCENVYKSMLLSEVARMKPGICDRTASITDPVEICSSVFGITILAELCRRGVSMSLLARTCNRVRAITGFY